jgi:hypothetical protein
MGAPFGNQNAAKGKRWAAAIERAIERQATGQPRPTDVSTAVAGLDMAAELFVLEMLANKDLAYFKEFGDRIDGKPNQTVDATVKGDLAGILSAIPTRDDPPLEA